METKTMNVAELEGVALDWAVAKCEGYQITIKPGEIVYAHPNGDWHCNWNWSPSIKWVQGGPIVEREIGKGMCFDNYTIFYLGYDESGEFYKNVTTNNGLLKSAMRCYVASKLGDTVEIPVDLL